jgi:hypothetical protein
MRKIPIPLVFAAIAIAAVTVMLNVAMSSIVTYQGTPISLGNGWIAVNATTQGHAYVNGTMRYVVIPVVSIYGKTLVNITAGNVLLFTTSTAKCAAVAYQQYYIGYQLYNNSGLWTPVKGQGSCPAQIGTNNVTYVTGIAVNSTGVTLYTAAGNFYIPAIYMGTGQNFGAGVGNYVNLGNGLVAEYYYYVITNGTSVKITT